MYFLNFETTYYIYLYSSDAISCPCHFEIHVSTVIFNTLYNDKNIFHISLHKVINYSNYPVYLSYMYMDLSRFVLVHDFYPISCEFSIPKPRHRERKHTTHWIKIHCILVQTFDKMKQCLKIDQKVCEDSVVHDFSLVVDLGHQTNSDPSGGFLHRHPGVH